MRRQSGEDAKVLVEWLGPWLSGGGSLLFMTDYDGTLTPMYPTLARLGWLMKSSATLPCWPEPRAYGLPWCLDVIWVT